MGRNFQWVAIQGGKKAILDHLGMAEAGVIAEEFRGQLCCAKFGGWVVLVSINKIAMEEILQRAPAESLVLTGEFSEATTISSIKANKGAAQIWSITHGSDEDIDGFKIFGEPPPQFEAIRTRLSAEQALTKADVLFDAPLELCTALCGYCIDSGADWSVLERRTTKVKPSKRRTALVAAIKSELIPLLTSLGWESRKNRTDEFPPPTSPYDVSRSLGGLEQMLWFEYLDAHETYFVTHFAGQMRIESEVWTVNGDITVRPTTEPLWKRFFALAKQPSPIDPVTEAIRIAREDILIADQFLRQGDPHRQVKVWNRVRLS